MSQIQIVCCEFPWCGPLLPVLQWKDEQGEHRHTSEAITAFEAGNSVTLGNCSKPTYIKVQ